jgi:spore coat polysaccharide biosynthesis protein SpsF
VDALISEHLATGADYTTNMGAGWPGDGSCLDGAEIEVASAAALMNAHAAACTKADREHVMPYLYREDHGFLVRRMRTANPFAPLKPRLNLDTPEDYEVISAIYDGVRPVDDLLPLAEVRDFLDRHPELIERNALIQQRGYR